MKILLYGVKIEDNFGGPSLLHGVEKLIRIFDKKADITFYQFTKFNKIVISDIKVTVKQIPYRNVGCFLISGLIYKLGINPKNKKQFHFLNDIKNSDIAIDLYGICFCANFDFKKIGKFKAIKSVIGKFAISFIAKLYGVKTVKSPASYGPIKTEANAIQARFAANKIFDIMFAREEESKRQMCKNANVKKNIIVSPDLANLMPYNKVNNNDKYISISISYQIINQWKANESYIECMIKLIKYILKKIDMKIMLIPNEIHFDNRYNDIDVAKDIHRLLDNTDRIIIPKVKNMNSTELKSLIAGSEVLIASRYHSCVAGLSSGVPTLILGWHYKYIELLHLYGQDKWILSSEDCTSKKLLDIFKLFWKERKKNKKEIKLKYSDVYDKLVAIGKIVFKK